MAIRLSKLQMTEGASWSGLTTENHLGYLALEKPQKASEIATKIYNANFGTDMYGYLNSLPKKYYDTDADFTWDLIGSPTKNVALVEARIDGTAITATDTPYLNGTEVDLVFPEAHFSDVNVIVGHKNEVYPIQILADPIPEGSNYVYRTRLLLGDQTKFMPFEELKPGTRFSREFSPVSHSMSKKGGEIAFTSPLTMRNAFSMIRLQHKVPGNMKARPLATKLPDEDGNLHTVWTDYEDYMFEYFYRLERNNLINFGRSNSDTKGIYNQKDRSGNKIKVGSGIREQTEASNTAYYTEFDIDYFGSVIMDLTENKSPMDETNIVVRTGKRGAWQFHKALENHSSLFTPNRTNDRIYKASSKFAKNALGYGGQFTEYTMADNIKVSISVDSMYDDKTRNKIEHPDGGVTESYRYDIMDLGTTDGEPNIQLCTVKGREDIQGHQAGFVDPYTPTWERSRNMSSSEDAYTIHRGGVMSAIVRDPSKIASFISTKSL